MNHVGDEGQRHQRDDSQPGIDREEDGRGHHDHQHIGGEIEQMQGNEDVDAVSFRTNTRHQVAGAFAAEVFQRQAEQVFIGGGAQVAAYAFGNQRQNIGAQPAEQPGN